MNLDAEIDDVRDAVRSAGTVVPVGGCTQWEIGGPPPHGAPVRAPAGVVDYDPAELTITLGPARAKKLLSQVELSLAIAGKKMGRQ